jgi:hypothetical protein
MPGPVKDGNAEHGVQRRSSDGSDDSDYQCDYELSLTNAEGLTQPSRRAAAFRRGRAG